MPKKPLKGTIKLDVRDSVADWEPYLPAKAPKSRARSSSTSVIPWPTGNRSCRRKRPPEHRTSCSCCTTTPGLAAWSPFGGGINMPTLQKLADRGLRYSQWHTTALCSPTRSTLLTGRNHHLNGMAAITEGANGFPGANGRIPLECATMPQILQDNGWSTFWLGKDHNVPEQDIASGATRKQWPLQQGFDRFYGFLGGETNQWYPDLVDDNKFIDQPYSPEEGYHLSRDLADEALRMLGDHHATNPSRPWYMWFCPGANHAPHHCPQDYIDKYKGKFDAGYEAYRESVLPRMIEKGILPKGTALTPLNPLPADVSNASDMVRPWDSLNADEKKLFSRLMEVYAGFSEYTDAQVGRIIDYLERTGQLDNTVVIYAADNGASGEGSPNGSVNENKFFNGYPDELDREPEAHRPARRTRHLRALSDRLGGGDVDAVQDVQALLGICRRHVRPAGDLVAEGHQGARRSAQPVPPLHRHRPDDPRHLRAGDAQGLPRRRAVSALRRVDALHLRRAGGADAEEAAVLRDARHPRACGRTAGRRSRCTRRSRARAISTRTCGSSTTSTPIPRNRRTWPRSTPRNCRRSSRHGSKRPTRTWCCRSTTAPRSSSSTSSVHRKNRRVNATSTMPGTSPVPEGVAVNVRGRSYKILADVEITDPNCSGVIFAHGSRFGGHSLFIKDKKLHLRLQLPRHPAGAGSSSDRSSNPGSTPSAWSSRERRPASTTSPSARPSST